MMKPDYRLGRIIVTSQLVGRNGKRDEHPAVIISPDAVLHLDEDIDFLLRDVPPAMMFEINSKYRQVLVTKLGKLMGTVVQSLGRLEGR